MTKVLSLKGIAALAFLAAVGCGEIDTHGGLVSEDGLESVESAVVPVPNPDCSFQWFTYNPETGQLAPPGQF